MLNELLAQRGWLLADGATGTNLFDMGLTSGDSPELWNVEHPARIRQLHQSFVEAGADIILTNSFGGNRRRLALHKLDGRTRELNRIAAEHGRRVADAASRPVIVAGSVGPTGDLLAPLGPLTEDAAVEIFQEQMEGLVAGGADLLWIETMSAPEEMRAAGRAAARIGRPFTVTASFDSAGRTMMGNSPEAIADCLMQLQPPPKAIGANCGVGASDLLLSILTLSAAHPEAVLVAKGNCGIPKVLGDRTEYSGTPMLMAEYARLALDAGARIIGGCCGTSPAHLAAMRRALESYQRRPRPDLEQIVTAIGPLVSPPKAAPAERRPRARR